MHVNPTGSSPGPPAVAPPEPPAVRARPAGPEPPEAAAAATRRAWFDVNGDGRIEDRSALYGGDGVLIVPEAARPDRLPRTREVDPEHRREPAEHATAVHVEHAREAYTRYGGRYGGGPAAGGHPADA
ncbi:MAG: hypothetical protein KatS3mg009_1326 [Acidimicrobiia bacterium]|nr:MAG: hypothetical protein KatS3mg009_1326 [Acidimicrobiia bacterium]